MEICISQVDIVLYQNMARKKFDSKRERFIYLAEKRTNSIINQIRILSHCSNKSLYEYDNSEIDSIFKAIEDALSEARTKLRGNKKEPFRLQP